MQCEEFLSHPLTIPNESLEASGDKHTEKLVSLGNPCGFEVSDHVLMNGRFAGVLLKRKLAILWTSIHPQNESNHLSLTVRDKTRETDTLLFLVRPQD